MREEEPNWFARWEEELPSPEELMPLSQTLITPDLALAFDIPSPTANSSSGNPSPHLRQQHHHLHPSQRTPPPPPPPPQSQSQSLSPRHNNNNSQQHQQNEFESSEGGGGAGGEEQARTLKRPRLVWTPQLHKRFVDAVAHLGIKNAVPKTIMQLMSVDGLTRENVASHLQKYRLYLKRMQGLSSAGGGPVSPADAATDHLFASAPLPHHFLNRGGPHVGPGGGGGGGGGGPDQYMPFVPVAALQHHQQMAAAAAAAAAHQQQFYHHRHGMGHIGSPPGGGFDHGFLTRQQPGGIHRMVGPPGVGVAPPQSAAGSYVDDLEPSSETGRGGRQVLTLFPTGDD